MTLNPRAVLTASKIASSDRNCQWNAHTGHAAANLLLLATPSLAQCGHTSTSDMADFTRLHAFCTSRYDQGSSCSKSNF